MKIPGSAPKQVLKNQNVQLVDFPRWLRALFAFALILFFVDVVYALAFLTGFWATWSGRIDQGVATLIGAIVGLGTVGWQARLGFANLIRSQEHRAAIEAEARRDQQGLDIERARQSSDEERRILMAALRAEIVGLIQEAAKVSEHATMMRHSLDQLERMKAPDVTG
jgi:hypothetical protein